LKLTHFNRKSPLKAHCEDAFFINSASGLFGVLDGVTPLHDFKDERGYNGAYIAANLFKDYFERAENDKTLAESVVEANRLLRERMLAYGVDVGIKHELWSTCIAAVHLRGDRIDYAQLGDSMIVAAYRDGRIAQLTENRVRGITERAKAYRETQRRGGADLPDESYYEVAKHRMIYNRWMANTPEGYGVANGMEEARHYMQTGTLDVAEIAGLLLMSDGLFFPGRDLAYTYRRIAEAGFETYANEVEQAERERGLAPDDRTGILLEF
jgi:hypothetical protein